jgi:hypothetical protein
MTDKRDAIADTSKVCVPSEHWSDLKGLNREKLCENTGAKMYGSKGFFLHFLNKDLLVDMEEKTIWQVKGDRRKKSNSALLELIALVYLLNASEKTISGELIGVRELKDAHFFQGPHAIDVSSLLKRYGTNISAFVKAAESLEGTPVHMADAAFRLLPFPKIPVYYLLWSGDDEFSPRLSVLFDRTIESHLTADAIWGLIHLITGSLTNDPEKR